MYQYLWKSNFSLLLVNFIDNIYACFLVSIGCHDKSVLFNCRWAKLRVAMLPLVIIFEPLSECMVIGACAAWAVGVLFQWDVLGFYLVHILVWFLLDWILLSIVQVTTFSRLNPPLTCHFCFLERLAAIQQVRFRGGLAV